MRRDPRVHPPRQPAELPAGATEQPKHRPAAILFAAAAGGVVAGVLLTWLVMRAPGGPGRPDDSAADSEPNIALGSHHGALPAVGRRDTGQRPASGARGARNETADSRSREAPLPGAAREEGDGDEPGSAAPLADFPVGDREGHAGQKTAGGQDLAQRRQRAFADFQSIGKAVSLPAAAVTSDIDGASRPAAGVTGVIDLGPFAVADLVEPKFRLAIPRDTIDGGAFKADIVTVEGQGDSRWEIRRLPSAVTADGSPEKPRLLARLIARDGRLVLEMPRAETGLPSLALLRRSVILAEAKDPTSPAGPATVREIRLVQPTKVKPLVIDLFAERRQELKLDSPAGISRTVSGPTGPITLAIPTESLRFEAEFPKGETVSIELPKDVREGTDPVIGEWQSVLAQLNPELAIEAVIDLSLPRARLTVKTRMAGSQADGPTMADIKRRFVDTPEEKLKALRQAFYAQVKKGTGVGFAASRTRQGLAKIRKWFSTPLASLEKGGLGVAIPGHDTVQVSFETFLEGRQRWLGDLDGFFQLCQRASDPDEWNTVYTQQLAAWAEWFWPQFERQWQDLVRSYQGAVAERHTIRIEAVTSLAYDETGQAYEVPLVIGDSASPPESEQPNGSRAPDLGLGLDGGSGSAGGGASLPEGIEARADSAGLD